MEQNTLESVLKSKRPKLQFHWISYVLNLLSLDFHTFKTDVVALLYCRMTLGQSDLFEFLNIYLSVQISLSLFFLKLKMAITLSYKIGLRIYWAGK